MTKMTLVFLINRGENLVLLGAKKTGFGKGKTVGIGGKVDAGESIMAAACREVAEEVSVLLKPEDLVAHGKIEFIFPETTGWHHEVHLFSSEVWQGTPSESPEIKPYWVATDEVPYEKMWDDAKYWLPRVLNNERLNVRITYNDDLTTVKSADGL